VVKAIREVQPFGVVVCSGLRPGGALDAGRLKDFFTEIARMNTD
jgi:hypothetical protein